MAIRAVWDVEYMAIVYRLGLIHNTVPTGKLLKESIDKLVQSHERYPCNCYLHLCNLVQIVALDARNLGISELRACRYYRGPLAQPTLTALHHARNKAGHVIGFFRLQHFRGCAQIAERLHPQNFLVHPVSLFGLRERSEID